MAEPEHVATARRVYDHSAGQFVDAVGTELSARFETPLDRAVLTAFAEQVSAAGPGPVLDIGCGPGRVAAFLAAQGLNVGGVDIAPAMVAAAQRAHPQLAFDVGALTALPISDGVLRGAVYWYSIITTPPADLSEVWSELDRVLHRDGHVLVAFQAGDGELDERNDAYGSSSTLTLYRHSPDHVRESLSSAGFNVEADVRREARLAHEETPQAMLLAVRHEPGAV